MSEYKNKWVLDLVTQENQWQNTEFRNNAVIFSKFRSTILFGASSLSEFFLSREMSCLVFSVSGSKAQLGRAHTPSAVGGLSSKPCWVWLLEIPVEQLLHNVPFHSVVLICCWPAPGQREPLADRLGGQQSVVIPQAKPVSTAWPGCWGTLETGRREQRSVCNQLVLLLNTLSKGFCYWPWGRMVY